MEKEVRAYAVHVELESFQDSMAEWFVNSMKEHNCICCADISKEPDKYCASIIFKTSDDALNFFNDNQSRIKIVLDDNPCFIPA
jgi:hypothetical protein